MPLDDGYGGGVASGAASQAIGSPPPPDPIDPIPTVGASGSYNTATLTVTSTLDPAITNLSVDRCYDTGHAAAGKLVLCTVFQGFEQPKAGVTTALRQRFASYVDPASGRAMCVLARDSRGRGGASDLIDYCRDTQDTFDCIDAQATALGSLAFDSGRTGIGVGYSTGAFDLALAACREPERFKILVFVVPNFDLGADPLDSYWALHNGTIRPSLTAAIGDRALGAAANIDPYLARNPIDAIARIVALPGGPEVWILADRTEAPLAGLPSPDRWAAAFDAVPGARSKLHLHITQAGDANRILHDPGVDAAGTVYAERYWVPWALANIAPWTMPRESPPNGFRVLGWMRTRAVTGASNPIDNRPGWEIWTGANSPPKSSAAGGRKHALELRYWDTGRQFEITPATSQDGYVQILRDVDDRTLAFLAEMTLRIDLNVAPTISTLADVGFTDVFLSDTSVSSSSWSPALGSKPAFASDGADPATGTDGDGVPYIGFTANANPNIGQRLVMPAMLFDPTKDFTAIVVLSESATTDGYFFEIQHHGDRSALTLWTSSTTDRLSLTLANASSGLVGNIGAHVVSTNTKHVFAFMKRGEDYYESLTGSAWSKSARVAGVFTTTDNGTANNKNTTSLACGWAQGAGVFYMHKTCRYYAVAAKQAATSEAALGAAIAWMKQHFAIA